MKFLAKHFDHDAIEQGMEAKNPRIYVSIPYHFPLFVTLGYTKMAWIRENMNKNPPFHHMLKENVKGWIPGSPLLKVRLQDFTNVLDTKHVVLVQYVSKGDVATRGQRLRLHNTVLPKCKSKSALTSLSNV